MEMIFEKMKPEEKFMDLWNKYIADRHGAQPLMTWLQSNGFFEAPASAHHHGAYPGGLCEHSLNVAINALLLRQIPTFDGVSAQEAVTAALLHDVCKVGIYRRDQAGIYKHEDDRVLGHGAASVILIRQYMQLTDAEQVAILWHMGLYGDPDKAKTLGRAYNLYPLAMLIHHADMMATYYCDGKEGVGLV